MRKIFALALILALFAAPALADRLRLASDGNGIPIQGFAPDPGKSENQTIDAAASYTLDVEGWTVVRFYSDGELRVSYNTNTAYFRMYEGTIVIPPTVTDVKFTNAGASSVNIDIEGM